LLIKTLKGLKDKSITPLPQSGKSTFAPPLKKENGRINWLLSAREITNLIRGTYPWPGAYCYLNGEKINIIKATVVPHTNIMEFINKKTAPSPLSSPSRGEDGSKSASLSGGLYSTNSSPPLRGGDEGEGDICGSTSELFNKVTVGRIEQISGSDILVSTGSGVLAISEVKPEGKKIMSASAFINGRHLKEGAAFDTL
jgi:methionyl-tRNA formyltransferase